MKQHDAYPLTTGSHGKQPRRLVRVALHFIAVAVTAVSLTLFGCAEDDDDGGVETVNLSAARANLNTMNGRVVEGLTFDIDARAFSGSTNVGGLITLSFTNIVDTDGDGDFDTGIFTATSESGDVATGTISFATAPFTLDTNANSPFPNGSGLGPDDLFTCSTSAAICRIEVNASAPVGGPEVLGIMTLVMGPAATLVAFSSNPLSVDIEVDAAGNVFVNGRDSNINAALP